MSYYRSANRPQIYPPGPSPSSHTYWRSTDGVPYHTQLSPMPARLSEENLARLDRGQARSSIFRSQTYSTNRAFASFHAPSRYSIGTSYPSSGSGTQYSLSTIYSSDSRRTPTPSIGPYSSPSAPPSRNHSPFPSPPPPQYYSPNSKTYPDANTPPHPGLSPRHNYPEPRPRLHRPPIYQEMSHFNNVDNSYGRTRFPPRNVVGVFPQVHPQYTPQGPYESDEDDDSYESDDSEFSSLSGSSLTSSSELEFFEEDSYDGDYEDASVYGSPGDAATL